MNRIEELRKVIAECHQEMAKIQEECSHPNSCVTYKYGANTGNYDPYADSYWVDFRCGLCGYKWWKDEIRGSIKEGMKEIK
jgi:hypothetical protein